MSALLLAACTAQPAGPAAPTTATTAAAPTGPIDPANIKRIRPALPAGYEVGDLSGPVSAAGVWGFGSGWTAQPPQCGALADPAPADPSARGYSASGSGGTVYVVVAAFDQLGPDPSLIGECGQWTMTFAHTSGAVRLVDAPHVDGVDTVGMDVDTRTVVESGTETDGQASTAMAYLGDHVVFVTLVTDPGSPHPPLNSQFVGDLLVETVSALRG
ncbi:hypothetical protein BayCH28_13170 [Mycolicibacterium sp. CH28]|nr:hypothetical protein BayCH28_13170 [Mycolicibacterium sp. CH28]